ncbi:hypothetical protein CC86DRAFT_378807 [Ophiobolus disseminans]|uniref:DUF7730 domain-containing protein n=1 Tax=Ophiobolus disseminans TaxID=1469910 RepID=A0A6A7AB97_9PLEO|nr:hypothetical protein CC86DRAFT_378807 [Ophiobolus disseminans]
MALLNDNSMDSYISYPDFPSSHTNEAHDEHAPDDQPDSNSEKQGPETDTNTSWIQLEGSRLLSLPKELRLEIWEYVLNNPSDGRLVLRVMRHIGGPNTSSKRFSNSLYKHPSTPEIETTFETSPGSPIGVSLLRTNHLIYAEALPILYQSVSFCPWHLEGIFPLFLDTLSAFAKANIRYIRMVPASGLLGSSSHFYWALTCAQVTKLDDCVSLREIEVETTDHVLGNRDLVKRAIMFPLLKIKAPKAFLGKHTAQFQQLLTEAKEEREAREDFRRATTKIEATALTGLTNLPPSYTAYSLKKRQKLQELTIRGKAEEPITSPDVNERQVARDLGDVLGTECWDISEWNMVSIRGSSSSPESDAINNDIEVDTTTTSTNTEGIASKDEDAEDWEFVDDVST